MADPPFGFRAGSAYDSFAASPGHAPNVNMQTQGQAAFTPSTTSSQQNFLAGADMSALEGISPEQLAAIARLFQSGALQMPPAAPVLPTHGPPADTTPSAMLSSRVSIAPQLSAAGKENNMDTEEGEVSESGEEYNPAQAREFLRPPPTGPKNRSVSPRGVAPSTKRYKLSPSERVDTSRPAQGAPHTPSQDGRTSNNGRRPSKKEAAKLFVREMVQAGYTYEDLASAVGRPGSLAQMFQEINLPLRGWDIVNGPARINDTAAPPTVPQNTPAQGNVNEDTAKASTKRAVHPKPAPVDRSAYLAKLQAAKNKKADVPDTSNIDAERSILTSKPVTPTLNNSARPEPSSSEGGARVTPFTASRAASMTELARQKLEALKAKMAADKQNHRGNASLPANQVVSHVSQNQSDRSPFRGGLGAGLANIATMAGQGVPQISQELPNSPRQSQSSAFPALQTPTRSFSGLPGLFMAGGGSAHHQASVPSVPQLRTISASQAPPDAATASPAPLSVPRKRAVASDFDDVAVQALPAKRPYGQSRPESKDESFVIEISDDQESDGEVDEMEGNDATKLLMPAKSFRDIEPLRDFAAKSNLTTPASTPRTPDGAYQQKMKEIEEFKRKIAEREMRQKASGKVTPFTPEETLTSAPSTNPTSGNAEPEAGETEESSATAPAVPKTTSANQTMTAATSFPVKGGPSITIDRERLKEKLRQRMLELEQDRIRMASPAKQVAQGEIQSDPQPDEPAKPVMSGALPPKQSSATEPVQPSDISVDAEPPVGSKQDSKSEEGELSDSSSLDFYDMDDVQNPDNRSGQVLDKPEAIPNIATAHISGQPVSNEAQMHSPTSNVTEDDAMEASSSGRADGNFSTIDEDESADQYEDYDDNDSDAMSLDSQESDAEYYANEPSNQINRGSMTTEERWQNGDRSRRTSTSSASDIDQMVEPHSDSNGAAAGSVSNGTARDDDLAPELQPGDTEPSAAPGMVRKSLPGKRPTNKHCCRIMLNQDNISHPTVVLSKDSKITGTTLNTLTPSLAATRLRATTTISIPRTRCVRSRRPGANAMTVHVRFNISVLCKYPVRYHDARLCRTMQCDLSAAL